MSKWEILLLKYIVFINIYSYLLKNVYHKPIDYYEIQAFSRKILLFSHTIFVNLHDWEQWALYFDGDCIYITIGRSVGRLRWCSQLKTILDAYIHQIPTIASKNGEAYMMPGKLMKIW